MKVGNIISLKGILYLIAILGLIGCFYFTFILLKDPTDAQMFKKEYESLNNEINDKSNKEYRKVSISSKNPIIYSTEDEIVSKIENKETFVVYFGFAKCPWCRSVIETLIKVANDSGLDKIYYVDIESIRDIIELDENNNLITKTKGTDGYYKLLEKFNTVLKDYTIKDKNENEIQTGEKRIYAPNIISIVDGEAKELATGISSLQTDAYMDLTDEMKNETYTALQCIIKCTLNTANTCSIEKSCD